MLVSDLPTPALLVDLGRLHANLDAVQARADALGVALRPHAKTHKSPAIARLQAERGARGLTVATVDEAEAFAAAGFDDLRLATPVVSDGKLARLARLASGGTRVSFTVDSAAGVARADRAFAEAGQTAEVLVEVDSGHGRCGVAWDEHAALARLGAVAGGAAGRPPRGRPDARGDGVRRAAPGRDGRRRAPARGRRRARPRAGRRRGARRGGVARRGDGRGLAGLDARIQPVHAL